MNQLKLFLTVFAGNAKYVNEVLFCVQELISILSDSTLVH